MARIAHEQEISKIQEIKMVRLISAALSGPPLRPGGGGGIPYDGLYGEAPPERGIFFRASGI